MKASIKAVGDWSNKMEIPLSNAIAATAALTGRSGRQACEQSMILMARSARARTDQAKKKRRVETGARKSKYVDIYRQRKEDPRRFYKASADDAMWERVRTIKERGLAKRSWFWGLSGLRRAPQATGKKIAGVAELHEFLSRDSNGLILTNKLKYMSDVTPSGLARIVAAKASTQIMGTAARAMERKFSVEVPRLAARRKVKATQRAERAMKKAWKASGKTI